VTERAHGTRAKYTIERCRCDDCREATRLYEIERRNDLTPRLVSAEPARQHLHELQARGMGFKRVAELAGISPSTTGAILYGKPGRPPTRRIKPSTLQAILAVDFNLDTLADGTLVDAAETHRNIARLVAAGVPKARIAERVGVPVLQVYPTRPHVHARTARIIAEMAAELDAGTLVTVRHSRYGTHTVVPETPVEEPRHRTFEEADEIDRFLNEMADIFYDKHADWRRDAACRGDERPLWMWFPVRGDLKTVHAAKKICSACFVRDDCLQYAVDVNERTGLWGGRSIYNYRKENPRNAECAECGEPFHPTGPSIVCSPECRQRRHHRQKMESHHRRKRMAS
jgi:transcriptional regulator with XRE-family HTH domain/Zn finger protein HypA/HybF involved in hydrogenase expression